MDVPTVKLITIVVFKNNNCLSWYSNLASSSHNSSSLPNLHENAAIGNPEAREVRLHLQLSITDGGLEPYERRDTQNEKIHKGAAKTKGAALISWS